VKLQAERAKMTLLTDSFPGDVSGRVAQLSTRRRMRPFLREDNRKRPTDRTADLKRRIPILKRLIVDCDRLAAHLDQEVQNEENRVEIHDRGNSAYSIYAKATASRRDNLRHSAEELRDHLAKAERALRLPQGEG
jgi:hypothetical protein